MILTLIVVGDLLFQHQVQNRCASFTCPSPSASAWCVCDWRWWRGTGKW